MPDLIYNVKFQLDSASLKKISIVDPSEISRVEELEEALAKANDRINELSNGSGKTKGQIDKTTKALSTSNQVLFSFSDLVQDSTQFSQGFAQGMRAIGNNVGFTAELFSNLQSKVDIYNDSLTESEKAQGKTRTVADELRKSFSGAGGALLKINFAVMATTFAFTLLDRRFKTVRESAKAQAEAFSEVAKSFSQIDTGVPDPFGLRARAVEIKILSEQVGMTLDEFSSKLADAFVETGTMGRIQAFFAEKLTPTILKVKGTIDEQTESMLIQLEANAELRKEIEKQKQVQAAYQTLLDNNLPLKNYVQLTKELSLVVAESRTGVDLSEKALSHLTASVQSQINFLTTKNDLNEEEIGLLFMLLDVQEKINNEKQKEIDLMLKREKIAMDTASIESQTRAIENEIAILKTRDERKAISLAKSQKDKDVQEKLDSDLFSLRSLFLKEEITAEQRAAREKALRTKADSELRLNSAQEDQQLADLRKENIKDALAVAGKFTDGFTSLKQQELQSELQAAKARGASAKEIEKIQRKQFEVDKKAQLAKAIINTASAVTEALPNVPKSILMGALGAIQIAKILQTKFGGGATSAGATTTRRGGGASNIMTTTGSDRPTSVNRSLSSFDRSDSNSFFPSSRNGGGTVNVTVVNTFDERTVASVNKAGEERRRSSAISAI